MKEIYKKYKREIWVGVVVSLITAAILEFGDWLISVLPTVGSSVIETISNVLYSLAATHTDNILLRLIFFGGFAFIIGTVSNSVVNSLKLYKKTLQLEKKSRSLSNEELEEINKQSIVNDEEKANTDGQERILDIIKNGKQIGKNAISFVLMVALFYLFMTFFVTTPMSLHNKFEQDMIKIAPYVDESEIVQLKSDWLCMRSKSEYDAIYAVINDVKAEHNLPD